jgi:hypothetical protein
MEPERAFDGVHISGPPATDTLGRRQLAGQRIECERAWQRNDARTGSTLGVNRESFSEGFLVAVAEACHQLGYGIGLKGGWDRHLGTQFNPPKNNSKAMIQSTGLLSHSSVSSL